MGERVHAHRTFAIGLCLLASCQFGSAGQGESHGLGTAGDTAASTSADDGAPPTGSAETRGERPDEGSGDVETGSTASTITGPPSSDGADTTTTATDEDGGTGPGAAPADCAEILAVDPLAESGMFEIDPPGGSGESVSVYCDMVTDGGGWTRFWWWTPGIWPAEVIDVLESPFGTCDPEAPFCFGRLPAIPEDGTSLYAWDPQSVTKYRWDFDSQNGTAHAAWLAFADHTQTPAGQVQHGDPWPPSPLEGSPPPDAVQDSFQYRTEHGVASIMLDDDNCDCETTLQMGHGMCYGGWGTGSSPENVYGVDRLHNPGVEIGPQPTFHLELYYR